MRSRLRDKPASARQAHVRAVRGLARTLLLFYGRDFRRAHRAAFADAAEHRWHLARRSGGPIGATLRTATLLLADTVRSAPRTWSLAPMTWVRTLGKDVRFGLRLLARQPGFTAAAALVLMLGIGANVAMFSLVNTLVLKPRAGGVDAALVSVHSRDTARPGVYRAFSFAEYEAIAAETAIFRSVSAQSFGLVGLREGDTTRRVFANIVSAEFFETLGVRPVIGRTFTADEARPGADVPVAILSYGAWRRRGGDDRVLQQTITLNRRAFTVVGVAPRGFGGSFAVAAPEVWVPTGVWETMAYEAISEGRNIRLADGEVRELALVARLHDGATPASVAIGLDLVSRRRAETNQPGAHDQALEVAPLSRVGVSTTPQSDGPLSGVAIFLLACSGIVLLIASFNLANMLLARGRSRRREFAIRLAIGGSRPRLVRQLLIENLLVAIVGGAAGMMLSWWAMRLLLQALPAGMPVALTIEPGPDGRVLAATLGFIVLGALVSGLGPALHLARADVVADLKTENDRAARRARRWHGLTVRDLLVTGQLALTLVMLTAAGLFVRGALEAARSDPGFTLDRGLIVNIDTSLGGYDLARSRDIQRDVMARLRAMPGVKQASVASIMPFAEFGSSRGVQKAGAPIRAGDPGADAALIEATTNSIGAGYFEAMGIPIRSGRDLRKPKRSRRAGNALRSSTRRWRRTCSVAPTSSASTCRWRGTVRTPRRRYSASSGSLPGSGTTSSTTVHSPRCTRRSAAISAPTSTSTRRRRSPAPTRKPRCCRPSGRRSSTSIPVCQSSCSRPARCSARATCSSGSRRPARA